METTRHIRHKTRTGGTPAPEPTIEDIDPGYAETLIAEIVNYGKPLARWVTGSTLGGGWERQVMITVYLDPVAGERRYAVETVTDEGDTIHDVWDYPDHATAADAAMVQRERVGAQRRLSLPYEPVRPTGASS